MVAYNPPDRRPAGGAPNASCSPHPGFGSECDVLPIDRVRRCGDRVDDHHRTSEVRMFEPRIRQSTVGSVPFYSNERMLDEDTFQIGYLP